MATTMIGKLPAFMSAQVEDARRFYLPARVQSSGLRVVSGGWEKCARNYEIRREGFMHPTLELVVSGRGSLKLGNCTTELRRGVVFSYGPGVAHELSTDPDDRLGKYFVNMTGATAEALMQEAGMRPGRSLALDLSSELEDAFEKLVSAGQRGTAIAARIAAIHARLVMLLVSEQQLSSDPNSNRARRTYLQCRSHVETHFLHLHTIEEAATACGITQPYFSRLFTRFAGQSAYQFLLRLKMGHAAQLLEQKGLNVTQTAEALSMDPFHFSRAFKRMHGRAPSAFKPTG